MQRLKLKTSGRADESHYVLVRHLKQIDELKKGGWHQVAETKFKKPQKRGQPVVYETVFTRGDL